MNVLLDTNALLWILSDDKRLGKKARELLKNPATELSVSYISLFEIAIKSAVGKIKYDGNIHEQLEDLGIEVLMLDMQHLENYKVYDQDNKDPFDNMLITVAVHNSLLFATSDTCILAVKAPFFQCLNTRL